jgi:hypothetical protein
MIMRTLKATIILGGVLVVAGCTSLPSPSRNSVRLVTEPPGAMATTTVGTTCTTPCSISVNRRDNFDVTFSMPGHETVTVQVVSRPRGPSSGIGLLDDRVRVGLIDRPIVMDPASAAAFEHAPNPVVVPLAALGRAVPRR